jgi:hypothetical protein
MAVRDVGMMRGFLMIAGFVVLGGFVMVMCGLLVVLGSLVMMMRGFFRHTFSPRKSIGLRADRPLRSIGRSC